MKNRIICISKGHFVVSFSTHDAQFQDMLVEVRLLPEREFDKLKRVWTLPITQAASRALGEFAVKWSFDVCNSAMLAMSYVEYKPDNAPESGGARDWHFFPPWEERPEGEA